MSEDYRSEFLRLMLAHEVLMFGEFTLKSGRKSPYFFDAGRLNSGQALAQVGDDYAQAIIESKVEFDMLFGPAYKGIPLATAAACGLQRTAGIDVPIAFDRKERKTHGEGGETFGAPLAGRVLMIDDVVSSGMTVDDSVTLIRAHKATPAGLVVLLDRGERGQEKHSAVEEIAAHYRMPVIPIIQAADFVDFLKDSPQYGEYHDRIKQYLERWGGLNRT